MIECNVLDKNMALFLILYTLREELYEKKNTSLEFTWRADLLYILI